MIERKQFTCYRSYYDAIRRLPKKDRLAAYDLLMEYAFFGMVVDMDALPPAVASMFTALQPNLDNSRRKAESRLGKIKTRTKEEQTENKNKSENECKSESKCKSEYECKDKKDSCISTGAYPRKSRENKFLYEPGELELRAIREMMSSESF